MKNQEIAEIFSDIARILEIKQDNPFRIRAYERAAQNLRDLSENIELLAKEERLSKIPGIGVDLSNKIKEFIATDKIKFYEDLKLALPAGLLDLLNIPSVGPKTVRLLYEKLKIHNIADLEKAIRDDRLLGLFGVKEKTIENIKRGLLLFKKSKERMSLETATGIAVEFVRSLKKLTFVKQISVAGSLRRQKETVRDIDILVDSLQAAKVMDAFAQAPLVKTVQAKGKTKSSVLTYQNVQVDCRVVDSKSFGAALVYFTGSKDFNIKFRSIALRKNLKVNEYGVFRQEKYLSGKTEREVFKSLGMCYIPPELRENTGEIELALKNRLPKLVDAAGVRSDLHVHSIFSDGQNTIDELAQAAKKKKYSFIVITDHSQSLKIANGLDSRRLRQKKKEIDRVNKKIKGVQVLYGTEVEIDSEGSLDYPDHLLREFDVVIAAIHMGFKQSKEKITNRLVRACNNRYVNIIAHPTGRLLGARDPYELDFEQLLDVCVDTNTALEINAFGDRLDLNDAHARQAKGKGVRLALGTDAHTIEGLDRMAFGVSIARRAWLERKDILNTLKLDAFLKTIKKK